MYENIHERINVIAGKIPCSIESVLSAIRNTIMDGVANDVDDALNLLELTYGVNRNISKGNYEAN